MDAENTLLKHTKSKIPSAEQSVLYLPQEVIEEILSRLAAKPLLRFRCVSKSWSRLIGSERFIKTHHQNLTKNTTLQHHRVLRRCRGPLQHSLTSLLTEPTAADPTRLYDPKNFTPSELERLVILGCCDGVVCVLDRRGRFHLWNPATRIRREVAELIEGRCHISRSGFGWDESSGAHKVFVRLSIHNPNHEKRNKIYSSKTNSWRTIEALNFRANCDGGQFASGKLHWQCRRTMGLHYKKGSDSILRLDLKSEEFGRMELPCDARGSRWSWLGVVEGRLAAVFKYERGLDVWVMMEEECWVKRVTVPNVDVDGVYLRRVAPLWIGEDGEVLLICNSSFVVYHPRQNLRLPLKEIIGSATAYIYVESLVSI